jgi:ketosteroid isomerase-like protein
MSNVELIKNMYAAFELGDIDSVLGAFHPDIEWVEPEVEGLAYGGVHRGRDVVAGSVLGQMAQTWEAFELAPEEWIDGGDTVCVLGQFKARVGGGREGSWRFAHVWKVRDGKAVRQESFFDTLAEWRLLNAS